MANEISKPANLLASLPALPADGALPCVARYFERDYELPEHRQWLRMNVGWLPKPESHEAERKKLKRRTSYGRDEEIEGIKLLQPILGFKGLTDSMKRVSRWLEHTNGTDARTESVVAVSSDEEDEGIEAYVSTNNYDHTYREGAEKGSSTFATDWLSLRSVSGLRVLLAENDFTAIGDTVNSWEPNVLELAPGKALCHVDRKIVVLSRTASSAEAEAYQHAGIATVLMADVLRRARESVYRWAGRVWKSRDEWTERQSLWNENRPKTIGSDDPVDEVARRILEGIYALRRPADAILLPRQESDSAWQKTPRQCRAELQPWFQAFTRAPVRCAVPPSIVAVLDAVTHGGHWVVRPAAYVDTWNATLQTVGGELFELTFWRAPEGASPPALCVVYASTDKEGRPYAPSPAYGSAPLADETHEAELCENWPNQRTVPQSGNSLLWTLDRSGCGDVACREFRLRIRKRIGCAPSAIGGYQSARTAVLDARRKSDRLREEHAAPHDGSYYDDDDSPSYPDSGEEDLADNFGGFGEDSD